MSRPKTQEAQHHSGNSQVRIMLYLINALEYHVAGFKALFGPITPPMPRQTSAAIQQAADQFVTLIKDEGAKARQLLERDLAALEAKFAQHRQRAEALLAAALSRATSAEEQLHAASAIQQPAASADMIDSGALMRAQDELRLLSELLITKDQKIKGLQQAVAERDQQIADLNERLLELERRSDVAEGMRASDDPPATAVAPVAHDGKDDDTMMEFLNMEACDPHVSSLPPLLGL